METNWYVITGAPCSGKTTVIEELSGLGFRVVHEMARAIIESELAGGKTLEQIKLDAHAFQRDVLNAKIDMETRLHPDEPVFLDRAIPDSIAYYGLHGFDTGEPMMLSQQFRYKRIFLFNKIDFEKDPVRAEDDTIAEKLDHLLESGYRTLGYDIVRVPLMPVSKRVEFIRQRI